VAGVTAEIGTGKNMYKTQGQTGLNRKIQLSISSASLNKNMNVDSVTKNMVLQGKIESKEAKGYTVDLGFRDRTKAFLKMADDDSKTMKRGKLVHIVVKNVIKASKVLKCEILSQKNLDCVQQTANDSLSTGDSVLTISQLKPGFLVSAKVSKQFDNGVEMTFLGGMSGTCFVDHY
jgi:hypothetical protein